MTKKDELKALAALSRAVVKYWHLERALDRVSGAHMDVESALGKGKGYYESDFNNLCKSLRLALEETKKGLLLEDVVWLTSDCELDDDSVWVCPLSKDSRYGVIRSSENPNWAIGDCVKLPKWFEGKWEDLYTGEEYDVDETEVTPKQLVRVQDEFKEIEAGE